MNLQKCINNLEFYESQVKIFVNVLRYLFDINCSLVSTEDEYKCKCWKIIPNNEKEKSRTGYVLGHTKLLHQDCTLYVDTPSGNMYIVNAKNYYMEILNGKTSESFECVIAKMASKGSPHNYRGNTNNFTREIVDIHNFNNCCYDLTINNFNLTDVTLYLNDYYLNIKRNNYNKNSIVSLQSDSNGYFRYNDEGQLEFINLLERRINIDFGTPINHEIVKNILEVLSNVCFDHWIGALFYEPKLLMDPWNNLKFNKVFEINTYKVSQFCDLFSYNKDHEFEFKDYMDYCGIQRNHKFGTVIIAVFNKAFSTLINKIYEDNINQVNVIKLVKYLNFYKDGTKTHELNCDALYEEYNLLKLNLIKQ